MNYILIIKDGKFRVRKYTILSDSKDLKYPSDHLPVYVEISYKYNEQNKNRN
jgi:endonuclease/exonuclease/phosphatase family metal-dependent hydrolase